MQKSDLAKYNTMGHREDALCMQNNNPITFVLEKEKEMLTSFNYCYHRKIHNLYPIISLLREFLFMIYFY